jgi:hypothetical protein
MLAAFNSAKKSFAASGDTFAKPFREGLKWNLFRNIGPDSCMLKAINVLFDDRVYQSMDKFMSPDAYHESFHSSVNASIPVAERAAKIKYKGKWYATIQLCRSYWGSSNLQHHAKIKEAAIIGKW